MNTPNDRIKRLRSVHSLIASQQYTAAIRQAGKVLEIGFKDCVEMVSNNDPDRLAKALADFNQNSNYPMSPDRMGLGSLVKLFNKYGLWDVLRIKLNSNLFYTQMIPWRKLVKKRNLATHQKQRFTREEALEMFHFAKVFLYDCELIPGGRSRIPDIPDLPMQQCHHCSGDVAPDWNYCPACGHRTVQTCTECHRTLSPEWNICPYCNTSRQMAPNAMESKAMYKIYCEGIWADLIVTPNERAFLEDKRLHLGLEPATASRIERQVIPAFYIRFKELLEAVLLDDKVEAYEFEFLMDKADELDIDTDVASRIIATYTSTAKVESVLVEEK